MKRWKRGAWRDAREIENPKIDAFLEEIWAVCVRHGMSLSHEDGHGAFIVETLDEHNRRWLFDAFDGT